MAQLNANIPYKECFIRNKYTGLPGELTHGYLFGVKSLINRPLLFHFMTDFGAVLWQLPISAFTAKEKYDKLSEDEEKRLQLLQTWDCQSNNIAVTTFAFLQNSRVDVRCRDAVWRSGKYLFTIDDYCGDSNELNVGFANDQDSKCAHFIVLDDGNFCAMPNNLLRWHNPDFVIPYDKINVPKIKLNLPLFNEQMSSEDIDRSYGNSPYYFYYQEVDENEQSEEEN